MTTTYRAHRKLSDGSYETVHNETESGVVLRPNGDTVEQTLNKCVMLGEDGKINSEQLPEISINTYTKEQILSIETAKILGLPNNAVPDDAWLGVISAVGYCVVTIQVRGVKNTPIPNIKISGLTGVLEEKTYTDENGNLFLIMKEGSYNLSVASFCIDAIFPEIQLELSAGDIKTVIIQMKSKVSTSTQITTSQEIIFSDAVETYDAFLVGGGGGGAGGYGVYYSSGGGTAGSAGGGGGGGLTKTEIGIVPVPFSTVSCIIGSGGSGGSGGTRSANSSHINGNPGSTGGSTMLAGTKTISATGGSGGSGGTGGGYAAIGGIGGNGGSGGGRGGGGGESYEATRGKNGGSDGENGEQGGTGQGTTTRAFGESTGTLYAGGGGGGEMRFNSYAGGVGSGGSGGGAPGGNYQTNGTSAGNNTGGGGGGGGGSYRTAGGNGGTGGSGIILIRWFNKA